MSTNSEKREFFQENGYWIEKGVYQESDMRQMFDLFYEVFYSVSQNRSIPLDRDYPVPEDVSYPGDLKWLDRLLLNMFKHDKDMVGECYDTIAYSSTFCRFFSKQSIEDLTRELLNLSPKTALYGWTNRVRIDVPTDERRTYGWHQEVFYTIPQSKYLQTWCPVIRPTTRENGTILVCPGSHKEGICEQWWHEVEGRATQIIVNSRLIEKYQPIDMVMQPGEVLFFDGHLIHRSGHNTSRDEVRFSMVGMWHDTSYQPFRAPRPQFGYRSQMTPRDYWESKQAEQEWEFESL